MSSRDAPPVSPLRRGGDRAGDVQAGRPSDAPGPNGVPRRDALARGAAVGGALLWSLPAVQALSMSAASAQDTSTAPSVGPRTVMSGTGPVPSTRPGATSRPTSAPGTSSGAAIPRGGDRAGSTPDAITSTPKAAVAGRGGRVSSPDAVSLAQAGVAAAAVAAGGAGLVAAGSALRRIGHGRHVPGPAGSDRPAL